MSSEVQVYSGGVPPAIIGQTTCQYVTMRISNQLFGVPVLMVQDVLKWQKVTGIPLSASAIAGAMNLRGRIVTAIDMRVRLGMDAHADISKAMSVVVEHNNDLFSLIVDSVGEVMTMPLNEYAKPPSNMTANWREIADGIYKLETELLVIIDVPNILKLV